MPRSKGDSRILGAWCDLETKDCGIESRGACWRKFVSERVVASMSFIRDNNIAIEIQMHYDSKLNICWSYLFYDFYKSFEILWQL